MNEPVYTYKRGVGWTTTPEFTATSRDGKLFALEFRSPVRGEHCAQWGYPPNNPNYQESTREWITRSNSRDILTYVYTDDTGYVFDNEAPGRQWVVFYPLDNAT